MVIKTNQYLGTKLINAAPMKLGEYNLLRGWVLPDDEDPETPGFLVEYIGGGKKNSEHFDNYISWSPADVFEKSYRPVMGLSFGLAIEAAKKGFKVARDGWNGKDMWIVLMDPMELPSFNTQGTDRKVNDRTAKWIGEDTPLETLPYFAMWTADKKWLPGWLASQTDMLADDWQIL